MRVLWINSALLGYSQEPWRFKLTKPKDRGINRHRRWFSRRDKEMFAEYVANHCEMYAPQLEAIGFKEGVDYVYHTSEIDLGAFYQVYGNCQLGGIVSI